MYTIHVHTGMLTVTGMLSPSLGHVHFLTTNPSYIPGKTNQFYTMVSCVIIWFNLLRHTVCPPLYYRAFWGHHWDGSSTHCQRVWSMLWGDYTHYHQTPVCTGPCQHHYACSWTLPHAQSDSYMYISGNQNSGLLTYNMQMTNDSW